MPELNERIAQWRREMIGAGVSADAILDELESHLRDDVERETRGGAPLETAFAAALRNLGQSKAIKTEFDVAGIARCKPTGFGVLCSIFRHALVRHKAKVLVCSLAGLGLAGGLFQFHSPPFQSEASLFIRVAMPRADNLGLMKTSDMRRETIMAVEMETLSSFDLAREVARNVGPEKILALFGGGEDLDKAAMIVRRNLRVESPRYSSVLRVGFAHPDSKLVQEVVREVINSYKKIHLGLHRPPDGATLQQLIDLDLESGRISNIGDIQTPTPPFQNWTTMTVLLCVIVVSGICVGLVWALLLEFMRVEAKPTDTSLT